MSTSSTSASVSAVGRKRQSPGRSRPKARLSKGGHTVRGEVRPGGGRAWGGGGLSGAQAVCPASKPYQQPTGRGWPRLEAALRWIWRWRGELEAEVSGRLLSTWRRAASRAPPGRRAAARGPQRCRSRWRGRRSARVAPSRARGNLPVRVSGQGQGQWSAVIGKGQGHSQGQGQGQSPPARARAPSMGLACTACVCAWSKALHMHTHTRTQT